MMNRCSDSQLIALVRESNHGAFHELHNRFWYQLYIIAYKRIGDPEETYDLLQDLFIEVWEKRHILDFNNTVASWLRNRLWFKVAIYFRNKGFKERHHLAFLKFLKTEEKENAYAAELESKESEIYFEEILTAINRCVEEMPARMKEIFLLKRIEDLSVKAIADQLDISPKTVKVQLERATARLRKIPGMGGIYGLKVLLIWYIMK